VVGRRQFLALIPIVLGAARSVWAQGVSFLRYRPLPQPAAVPLDDMLAQWRSRQFIVDAVTLDTAATPNQPLRITGMVVRTGPAGDNTPDRFQAVCLRCPHEGCEIEFVTNPGDPAKIPPELVVEIGHPLTEPVYVCPCHNSTFAAETGERLAGPAPRGLYRFRVTKVTDKAVEIGEIEEDLLLFVP
jgi:Rieske Fe-S protein